MSVQKLTREELADEEYESLLYPKLYSFLTDGIEPSEEFYLRDEEIGFVVGVTIFDSDQCKKFHQKMSALEWLGKRLDIRSALGV